MAEVVFGERHAKVVPRIVMPREQCFESLQRNDGVSASELVFFHEINQHLDVVDALDFFEMLLCKLARHLVNFAVCFLALAAAVVSDVAL